MLVQYSMPLPWAWALTCGQGATYRPLLTYIYTALMCKVLVYTALMCKALVYTTDACTAQSGTVHYGTLHRVALYTIVHCTEWHCTLWCTAQSGTVHYSTLHWVALYTMVHYTKLHSSTLHFAALPRPGHPRVRQPTVAGARSCCQLRCKWSAFGLKFTSLRQPGFNTDFHSTSAGLGLGHRVIRSWPVMKSHQLCWRVN